MKTLDEVLPDDDPELGDAYLRGELSALKEQRRIASGDTTELRAFWAAHAIGQAT